MKHFQVLASGKPIIFFEVAVEYADDEVSARNTELAANLAGVLDLESYGPIFVPQLISKIPLAVADREPDHKQEGLNAWISLKVKR